MRLPPRKLWLGASYILGIAVAAAIFALLMKSKIQFLDLKVAAEVLPLQVRPSSFAYLCIVEPYRTQLLRAEAVELSDVQWRDASIYLEAVYPKDDGDPALVVMNIGGKFIIESLDKAAGSETRLSWKVTVRPNYLQQVCARYPHYQLSVRDQTNIISILTKVSK